MPHRIIRMIVKQQKDFFAILFFLACIMFLLFNYSAFAHDKSINDIIEADQLLKICGESVPIDEPQVKERFEKEMLLSLWDQPQVILWLKRSSRYFPYIEQQLKENKMPDDLKYLAVAESALRPHAGSPKGAIGFWQLMPQTARRYDLVVDPFIDERRNLYLSTPAALRYLQELYNKFGSWTLAMAAYNMGEEGLEAEVLEQDTKDYYQLYLPLETQRFIFRILAVKLIMADPKSYGFIVPFDERYQPLSFDSVSFDCLQEVPIQLIADASGSFFKSIKDLNPHLRGHYIQAGHYQLNVPAGKAKAFNNKLNRLVAKYRQDLDQRVYVVQKGDSLSKIADQFEVPLQSILIWNRLNLRHPIHPGDRLIIYPKRMQEVGH